MSELKEEMKLDSGSVNAFADLSKLEDATAHVELTEDGVNKIVEDLPEQDVNFHQVVGEMPEIDQQAMVINDEVQYTEQDKKEYEEWVMNPENKKNAQFLANQIIEVMGERWFTLNFFCKKAKLERDTAFQKLYMCRIFGFMLQKDEKVKEDGIWQTLPMFKVSIDNKSKIEEIDRAIAFYYEEIKKLELQKSALQNV